MVRNVDSPSKFLIYLRFLQVLINNQVGDLSSHTTRTRQNCSSIRDYQAQAEGKEIREEEEIKAFWFKEIKESWGRIEAIDADEDITLVDMETKIDLGAELQGRKERKDDDNAVAKEVNAVEPTVFDDKEVTMTMTKPISVAQARKNTIVYLKNIAGYKMEHFRGMTYDQVKYPLIDWKIHSKGSISYWKIIRVGGITEAYQSFEDMLKSFDREDLDAL
nr:leucine-rich repeat protein [Tanacetum cinerariifolium]